MSTLNIPALFINIKQPNLQLRALQKQHINAHYLKYHTRTYWCHFQNYSCNLRQQNLKNLEIKT